MSKLISKRQLLDMPEGTIFATAHPESRSCSFYTSSLYRKGKTTRTIDRTQCEAYRLFPDGNDRTARPVQLVAVRHLPDSSSFECSILVYEEKDILALYRGLETELARITGKSAAIGPQRATPSSPARVESQSRSALREYNETVSAIDPDGFKKEIHNQPPPSIRERRFLSRLEEGGE